MKIKEYKGERIKKEKTLSKIEREKLAKKTNTFYCGEVEFLAVGTFFTKGRKSCGRPKKKNNYKINIQSNEPIEHHLGDGSGGGWGSGDGRGSSFGYGRGSGWGSGDGRGSSFGYGRGSGRHKKK